MDLIYIDYETYYDKVYTLRNMTPFEYILDPRYETIGCGVAINNGEPFFLEGDDVAKLLKEYPRPYALVSYNALFDASITSFRYGIHPDLLIDAMGIVRATLQHAIRNGRVSLDNVAQVLNLKAKGDTVLKVIGMRRADIKAQPQLWADFKQYCLNDTLLCRSITQLLAPQFPRSELWVMSTILKMCTKPKFFGNLHHLQEHLNVVLTEKEALLSRVGLTRADMLSNDKFADALKRFGVDPPTKPSHADPSKTIWAFAKTDEEFRDLEEHENPDVQALVAARVGVKSTLEERRTQRFIAMTESAQNAFNGTPWLPVALRYAGAHTHRFSGEWKVNMQNLPSRKNSKIRESLTAPPGYKIVEVDASQIQCRLTAWLAGEQELLNQFKSGTDVYAWFGSEMFKRPINKKDDPIERFISKENVLGLGFQMGASKLLYHLTNKAADYGIDITFTFSQCEVWVQFYRFKFKKIRGLWYTLENILSELIRTSTSSVQVPSFKIGPCHTEGTDLVLPNGLKLYYDNLREVGYKKIFDWGRERREIYGGKYTENLAQALDRAHVMDAAYRVEQSFDKLRIDAELAHQMHDALIYIVPDGLVSTVAKIVYEEMKTPASWGVGLPLDAEVKVGQNYGAMQPFDVAQDST